MLSGLGRQALDTAYLLMMQSMQGVVVGTNRFAGPCEAPCQLSATTREEEAVRSLHGFVRGMQFPSVRGRGASSVRTTHCSCCSSSCGSETATSGALALCGMHRAAGLQTGEFLCRRQVDGCCSI